MLVRRTKTYCLQRAFVSFLILKRRLRTEGAYFIIVYLNSNFYLCESIDLFLA